MHSPIFLLGLATALGSVSNAHTVFTTFFVNDVNQGDGTCVRMDTDGNRCTGPVRGVEDSPDMACGREGQNPVKFTCPASAGDKITVEFREWADYAQQGVIDSLHKGPAAIYVKAVSNMASDSAAGDGWFKIWDEGYDEKAGKWATEKLIDSKGLLSVKVPSGLPTGYYLWRTELLTFQNVTNNYVDPQFYIGCAQLFIKGTSSGPLTIPSDRKVSIPGHVKLNDKSLHFNIYDQPLKLPYSTPGPKPFVPTASGPGGQSKAIVQTQGLVPDTCLIKNANWCAVEVPSYTTESGCWASLDNCYKQLDTCYKTFPPSGAKGCDKWDKEKCKVIDQGCQSRQFTGPPNKNVKLRDASAPLPGPIPDAQPEPFGAGEPQPQPGTGDGDSTVSPPSPSVSAAPDKGNPGEDNGDNTSVNPPAPTATSPSPSPSASDVPEVPIPSSVYVDLPVVSAAPSTAEVTPLPSTFSTVAVPAKPTTTKGCGGGGQRPPLNYGYKKGKKVKQSGK